MTKQYFVEIFIGIDKNDSNALIRLLLEKVSFVLYQHLSLSCLCLRTNVSIYYYIAFTIILFMLVKSY